MVEARLTEILKTRAAGPFLFVGSGFSRRYLGLEDWKDLLSRFCVTGKPIEYYLASADGSLPKAAKILTKEFNDYWWSANEYKKSVEQYKGGISHSTSALRIEICNYLMPLSDLDVNKSSWIEEIELLSGLNVDGVITTNWDVFLEQLFPDYRVYVGQNELLFSTPQEIGEIYKIHGCATKPESLVLTSDDYLEFNKKNPYLAAKLITVFVEHPVVFIGYSISDENVSDLLRAISLCVGKDNLEKLRKNLIFVQRVKEGAESGISDTYITIDGVQIPLILVATNDFSEVYRALNAVKRKIPARILRYCKEQLYELVKSLEPEKKLSVVDLDEIEQKEDVEFLVGVGVTSYTMPDIGKVGYEVIETKDLIDDLLHENKKYDAEMIIANVIKSAGKHTKNIPVFKYLREIGICDASQYQQKQLGLDKWVNRELDDFKIKSCKRAFLKRGNQAMAEIISSCTAAQAACFIPFLSKVDIDLDELKKFLLDNEEKLDHATSPYASNFRKLAALYDRLRWGW
ncbi:hypothetical protein FNU76_00510 [Chitinimonas arctica]|uniref:Uncharacterized protein n=1 Tax=Chitinimonas arctica TaxID=2594795 RepID=A0A516SA69_9NEIS|nr:SIR2 family protein [Chitinimonas arctica]QDQ24948.1 hypothetical protein FNU76_00510 [Chitinimonas arctica]